MEIFVVEIEYNVHCDVCGEFDNISVYLKHEDSIKNAKKDYKERGWRFKGSYAICPECQKRKIQ